MSLRFQARLAADSYSQFIDMDTRSRPVAQTDRTQTSAALGNGLDLALGGMALSTQGMPWAQRAIGGIYLVRATGNLLRGLFTGARISITGSGSGSSVPPEVKRFNRQHCFAAAATNATVGLALMTGIAGAEAALFSTAKGGADLVLGPGLAYLTRPRGPQDADELLGQIKAPKSDRHRLVAQADLEVLGASAMPHYQRAFAQTQDKGELYALIDSLSELARDYGRSRSDKAVIANAIAEIFSGLVTRGASVDVLQRATYPWRSETSCDGLTPASIEALRAAEQTLIGLSQGEAREGYACREARDCVGYALARAEQREWRPLSHYLDLNFYSITASPEGRGLAIDAVSAFGAEAEGPVTKRLEEVRAERVKAQSKVVATVDELVRAGMSTALAALGEAANKLSSEELTAMQARLRTDASASVLASEEGLRLQRTLDQEATLESMLQGARAKSAAQAPSALAAA